MVQDQNYLGRIDQISTDVAKTLNGLGLN